MSVQERDQSHTSSRADTGDHTEDCEPSDNSIEGHVIDMLRRHHFGWHDLEQEGVQAYAEQWALSRLRENPGPSQKKLFVVLNITPWFI
jgi:hypothetical protein